MSKVCLNFHLAHIVPLYSFNYNSLFKLANLTRWIDAVANFNKIWKRFRHSHQCEYEW